ncbi:MAG: GTPase ObgE [uncultured bacterium]|nr:MAG: GTPase ObgE [uncultured bacterium]
MFIDSAEVSIKSGDGGDGCLSFHREKFVPKGGPDGGDGGDGGAVIFIGDNNVNTLAEFRHSPKLFAQNGQPGKGSNKSGKKGKDVKIRVPCGTIIKAADTGQIVFEILHADEPVIVANGGKGGRGNQHFASSTDQAPRKFEPGKPGFFFKAVLELKIMADAGLVGLPNAGKSSLISVVSNARPKIADYPFTTLFPNLGVVDLPDYRSITIADIPGIIAGASCGKGLGIQFLKHVERTKVLLIVIDVSDFASVRPSTAFKQIMEEIKCFGHNLDQKELIIAANKIDLDYDESSLNTFKKEIPQDFRSKVYPVSAVSKKGIPELIVALDKIINRI